MNARRSKQLRRDARNLTVGRPWRAFQKMYQTNANGKTVGFAWMLAQGCGRALYQRLKRA